MAALATADTGTTAHTGKYLTILIAGEAYGIAVLKVREIIRLQRITPIPQVPDYVRGVINLRGRVIPVIDLRTRFGASSEFAERTCIVVVQVLTADRTVIQMGLVVDSVEEVVNLTADQIAPTPDFGVRIDTAYILGMAKVGEQVKTLLDIDRVVTADALDQLTAATAR
jgi:purine-binding chemotaxis protein CheW